MTIPLIDTTSTTTNGPNADSEFGTNILSLGYMVLDDPRQNEELINEMVDCKLSFMVTNLSHADDLDKYSIADLNQPLAFESLNIKSTAHISVTVPYIQHFFNTSHVLSEDCLRLKANLHLRRLFNWAGHLGVSAVILPLPETCDTIPEFARCISSLMTLVPHTAIWIHIRISDCDSLKCWYRWNMFRSLLPQPSKFHIALELMHPVTSAPSHMDLWLAEPLAASIIPTNSFTLTQNGTPTLAVASRQVIFELMKRNLYFLISNPTQVHPHTELYSYVVCIRNLYRSLPALSVIDQFAKNHMDHLQAPLQPLMDNLDAYTYEVFEQDPVKYRKYTEAISVFCNQYAIQKELNVLVVGAGPRGPLIDCVIKGTEGCGVCVKIVGVEKNSNAFVSLQKKRELCWDSLAWYDVSVVFGDIRTWCTDMKFDLVVSELLGSFGDNELSPECLDGVQEILKNTGAYIPQSYTPYITPISSPKLYEQAQKLSTPNALETSYVVMIQNARLMSETQPLWTFTHPNPNVCKDNNLHNQRYVHTQFTPLTHPTLVHGFAGYFECVLFGHVTLSTRPESHTADMTSWFPIYFPIKNPVLVGLGTSISVHVWRVTGKNRVWYEWSIVPHLVDGPVCDDAEISVPVPSSGSLIHNSGGKCHSIGL